ncbi:hypothetical protein [Pseudomonas sp. GV047]|uniref:hypothetical protein n=1 Tax=Pseudomonas sp. GV047 TaxID=2135751 RepID=UPI000D3782EF|nr:hypothetical protein [Pseudomonas sp. GV047]PUB40051.1 hypothetical protein C8K58_11437 [Pseudomonas sp. GV047]
MTMTSLEATIDIGTLTKLSDKEWRTQFLATLDSDGDSTHETMLFIRDNRYPNDCEDENLENYQDVCHSLNIPF